MTGLRLALFGIAGLALALIAYVYSSPTIEPPRTVAANVGSSDARPDRAAGPAIGLRAPPPSNRKIGEGVLGSFIVPVNGVVKAHLVDTWGQSREGGKRAHEAIDIMAPGGTPVVAAISGRVEKLFDSVRGGITAYVRSDDDRWQCYYAHLQRYADGLREGQRVRRGDLIGFVGDTGDAGPGNTHLHFAVARMGPNDRWWQGTPVNPYPILAASGAAR